MLNFVIDREKCTKCGDCIKDCPVEIIKLSAEYPFINDNDEDNCIKCQHCFTICEPGAISILGLKPDDSIPLKDHLPNGEQMECLIKGRRSVRHYKDEPVDSAVITHLLKIVASGPVNMNKQLLFTVVEDQETMQKVRHDTMKGIKEALVTSNLPSGSEFFSSILDKWDDGKDIVFRHAPHLLIVSSPTDGPSPEADAIIALSYFELLAQSYGIGTQWSNLADWAIATILPDLKSRLNIPESYTTGYMMLFGKPAVKYHRTVQRSDANISRVVWND
ncbi:MAG: nitroreductase family protein [Desulfobulbaceae bacterium]|nr:nitroreductase family protein [Desulfobulbaceae bacterium]